MAYAVRLLEVRVPLVNAALGHFLIVVVTIILCSLMIMTGKLTEDSAAFGLMSLAIGHYLGGAAKRNEEERKSNGN